MNPGEPITRPACVSAVDSTAREMPKSMTRGPSSAISTFDGLRSRCTTPAAWIALRLSARPAVSVSNELAGSGPCSFIASVSEGPGTYAVASHATGPSTSASTTMAVNRPLTLPRRGDLPAEPHPEIRILGQLSADDLDRDRPAARGDAEVHPPHATAAKLPHQPVRTDRLRIPWLQSLDHAGPPNVTQDALRHI